MSDVAWRAASPPAPQDRDPGPEGDAQLFTGLVVSNPAPPRRLFGMPASLAVHAAVAALAFLLPILWPQPLPDVGNPLRVLLYSPPAAAAAPLPRGSALLEKVERAKPVTPDVKPRKPVLEIPTPPKEEQPLEPEARAPESEQAGSPTGSDLGIPEGMEGGVEGGVAGGVPGGVVGGCVGCSGDGPVMDYDQPPRLLKQVKPQYPQQAFVKKIEGTVVLEILIDGTGRVVQTRVVRSIPALDEAARQCVLQWVFAPAVRHGHPVATLAQAPVTFTIY